ncbi:NifU family protein [Actinoplanes sp. NPDC049802]|uniref:NifU family protein n=1 Tax=Actinoplanes sp. NPDC049802 TaxID=3154742 RepID=UPI0033C8F086
MVPLHPQPCPGRPDRLRWIVPAGLLPLTGVPARVPAPLERLLADGTLAAVSVEPGAVVTTLAGGNGWAKDGPRVRSALHAALRDPAGWEPDGGRTAYADEPLREAAVALLDGSAGEFARSHGGRIDLVDVRDGVVTVRLAGACDGCPAAQATLQRRLADRLRRRCPGLRAVVACP